MCEAYGEIKSRPTLNRLQYDLTSATTFLIKLVRLEKEWKIISLDCIYDSDNLVPLIYAAENPFSIKFPRQSYRCLAHVLEKTGGYKMDETLPGWDRPADAQTILREARKWASQF